MKLFACQNCDHVTYFENTSCEKCGNALGYLPDLETLSVVRPAGPMWQSHVDSNRQYRFCRNWELGACNWLVDAAEGEALCKACRHNQTIPDISDPLRHSQWSKIEDAKRRLFYSLIKLGLPTPVAGNGASEPLIFQFLADMPDRKNCSVCI